MSIRSTIRVAPLAAAVAAAAMLAAICVGQARAETTYPTPGGSTFSGSGEGWFESQPATCAIGLLCTATAGYDGAAGNPGGSLALRVEPLIDLLGLFGGTVTFESPEFVAQEGGAGTLRLERALASTSINLLPGMEYTVRLVDRTKGSSANVLSGAATGVSGFVGESGAVTLDKGHKYAIQIDAKGESQLLSLGLLGATAAVHFDNVALTVGSSGSTGGGSGGPGGPGGSGGQGGPGGAGGLTNAQLLQLIRRGGAATAVLKGNRVFINSRCPGRIGTACRIVMQGHLNKRKAATNRRRVRIGKGKGRRVALTVKRFARAKVKRRKRLLVKQTVRARGAKATVFKSVRLVRR